MKDWTIGEALIVVAIVCVGVAVVAVAIMGQRAKGKAEVASGAGYPYPHVRRFIDHDAGAVCWVYKGGFAGGIHCLPLEQTRLRAEGP